MKIAFLVVFFFVVVPSLAAGVQLADERNRANETPGDSSKQQAASSERVEQAATRRANAGSRRRRQQKQKHKQKEQRRRQQQQLARRRQSSACCCRAPVALQSKAMRALALAPPRALALAERRRWRRRCSPAGEQPGGSQAFAPGCRCCKRLLRAADERNSVRGALLLLAGAVGHKSSVRVNSAPVHSQWDSLARTPLAYKQPLLV